MSGTTLTSSYAGDTSEGTSDEEGESSGAADVKLRLLEAALGHVVSTATLLRLCHHIVW